MSCWTDVSVGSTASLSLCCHLKQPPQDTSFHFLTPFSFRISKGLHSDREQISLPLSSAITSITFLIQFTLWLQKHLCWAKSTRHWYGNKKQDCVWHWGWLKQHYHLWNSCSQKQMCYNTSLPKMTEKEERMQERQLVWHWRPRKIRTTYWAKIGVFCYVVCNKVVFCRQGHYEKQRIPGLLAYCSFSMDERDQQGKNEEIGSSLVLASVEKQF